MRVGKRLVAAAILWFASILMMVIAVSLPESSHLAGWSILAAIGGCLPAVWLIIDHVVARERQMTRDEIRDIARVVLAEQRGVRSI